MLIQMLKLAIPSLAIALSGGLISMLTPPAGATLCPDLADLPNSSAQRHRREPTERASDHPAPADP